MSRLLPAVAATLLALPTALLLPPLALVPVAQAQEMADSRLRAANLARMEAERLNGGLSRYNTAACMHQRGGGDCLVRDDQDGYLFTFLGGVPGWQALGKPASVETTILISPDGRDVLQVQYNGAPR
ncbi:MAG: hypothetical protein VKJ66_01805 [Synechococcus sp.]|nr:hypothetical protein [Synechococcus sp.]